MFFFACLLGCRSSEERAAVGGASDVRRVVTSDVIGVTLTSETSRSWERSPWICKPCEVIDVYVGRNADTKESQY